MNLCQVDQILGHQVRSFIRSDFGYFKQGNLIGLGAY